MASTTSFASNDAGGTSASLKPASSTTRAANLAAAQRLGIDVEAPAYPETTEALRGLILPLSDPRARAASREILGIDLGEGDPKDDARAIPPVPDTVHPGLWLSRSSHAIGGVFRAADGVYQVRGVDIENITFVRGASGWIVLDAATYDDGARLAVRLLEIATGDTVRGRVAAVVYSHSHIDSFGGILGILEPGQIDGHGNPTVPVFAPLGFMEHVFSENVLAGPAMRRRASYQFGNALPEGDRGALSSGAGPRGIAPLGNGTSSLVPPTHIIEGAERHVVDGVALDFRLALDTEAPAEMYIYIEESRVLWMGGTCCDAMHNLYTMRGAQVRDASNWARVLTEAAVEFGGRTDVVTLANGWPHANSAERPRAVIDFLLDNAAVYKFTHDQVLLRANRGETARSIARTINLPDRLERAWYVRPTYGTLAMNARGVYDRYLGLYNGNPVELAPLDEREQAREFVSYAGGADAVVKRAEEQLKAGSYQQAAWAAMQAVYAEPGNRRAREIAADALEQLGYQSESGIFRNAYLSGAQDLRASAGSDDGDARDTEISANGTAETDTTRTAQSSLIATLPPQLALDYLGVAIDGTKLGDASEQLLLEVADGEPDGQTASFLLIIHAGALLYHAGSERLGGTDVEAGEGATSAMPCLRLTRRALTALARGDFDGALAQAAVDDDARAVLDILRTSYSDPGARADFPLVPA